MRAILIISFLSLSTMSCSLETSKTSSKVFKHEDRHFIQNENLGTASGIMYDDGYYLVTDVKPANGKYFKVLNKNFEILSDFGERGNGPRQIDGRPGYMPPMPFIQEGSFHFIGGLNLYKFSSQNNYLTHDVIQLEYPKQYHTPPQHYLVAQDSLLWVNGGSFQNRFFVFDLHSKEMIKEIPHLAEFEKLEMEEKIFGFNAHGVYDEYNHQIIWAYFELNLIEIYSPLGELKRRISLDGPLQEFLKSDPIVRLPFFQNVTAFKNGFVCGLYDRDIIAKQMELIRGGNAESNNPEKDTKWLVVFDANGNEKGRIMTPSFTYYTINPDEELLVFTSSEREDYPIFTLPLPDLIKAIL